MKRGQNKDSWNIRGHCKQPRGEMVRAETTEGVETECCVKRHFERIKKKKEKLMANKAASNFNFGKWVVGLIYLL